MSYRSTLSRSFGALLLTASLLNSAGCARHQLPVLEPLLSADERTPVVIIPGVVGSKLMDFDNGKVVWGKSRNLFWPRDGGKRLAIPLDPATRESDTVDAYAPVLSLKLFGIFSLKYYIKLVQLLEANGYRAGDLTDPQPGDSVFVFYYDWRKDTVHAARQLAGQLDRLRVARGEDVLSVDLIGQSNAARVARYYLKYGGAAIDDAAAGHAGPPEAVRVRKLLLLGTGNGGALRVLKSFNTSRVYVPMIGKKFNQESVFTLDSLFDSLPAYRDDLFFDDHGNLMDIDLYDAASWQRFGWSIYSANPSRRLAKLGDSELYGNATLRFKLLQARLDRARTLHRLLGEDVAGFGDTRYYLIQNGARPTAERAMLVEKNGQWRTLFDDSRQVRKNPALLELAEGSGDGHATLESQNWISPQERSAIACPTVYVDRPHRKIPFDETSYDSILRFLAD